MSIGSKVTDHLMSHGKSKFLRSNNNLLASIAIEFTKITVENSVLHNLNFYITSCLTSYRSYKPKRKVLSSFIRFYKKN